MALLYRTALNPQKSVLNTENPKLEWEHLSRVEKLTKSIILLIHRKVKKMQYDKSFKEEAVKLSDEIGVKVAVTQLGIPYYTLSGWDNN